MCAAQTTEDSSVLSAPGPQTAPLATPTSDSRAPGPIALTADQPKKYEWLLAQAKGWATIPSLKGDDGPLTDTERMWLTRECFLRYLRATKWQERDSEKRLLDTLAWRRDFGIYNKLTPEYISPENETGKQIIAGYDKECRPCHYLSPGRQNTDASHRQVEHLVFMVERVIELTPANVETLALLINFKSSKSRSNTAPGLGQAREVLNILQTHYPERLGKAMIINVPWIVNGFFKLIMPFVDPMTRAKVKFNEDMKQYVPAQQLWSEFSNGDMKFEYDHAKYWPALNAMCDERRAAWKQRWEAGGRMIGEHEDYLKGLEGAVSAAALSGLGPAETVKES